MSSFVVVGAAWPDRRAAARRSGAGGLKATVVDARERVGGPTEGLVLADGTPLQWYDGRATPLRVSASVDLAEQVKAITGIRW